MWIKIFYIVALTTWSFILINHLIRLINKNVKNTIIQTLKEKKI